jgi:hypothetical protein
MTHETRPTGWVAGLKNFSRFAGMRSTTKRPIVFVHVPKTAGTAVTHYLTRSSGPDNRVAPPFLGDYSIYKGQTDRWSLIAGHFYFSKMRNLVPNADFFTFLRDPVARAISLYRSWRDPSKMTPMWRDVLTPSQVRLFEWVYTASLEEFVMSDDPAVVANLSNNMTLLLSSDGTADAASALHNLKTRFVTFGIQESFDESIQRMRSVWPWLGPYRLQQTECENRSTVETGAVTVAVRRRLEELNVADLEFYSAAKSLFHQRLSSRNAA